MLNTPLCHGNDQEALYAVQDMMRDQSFGWNTYAWANLQTKTGKGAMYVYYFDQQSQNSILKQTRGATHVAEMPFIYGWNWGPMTETEKVMASTMSMFWINFIKTGNPNYSSEIAVYSKTAETIMDIPYWSNYKFGESSVMTMHEGFEITKMPNQKQMDFWEEYFKSYRMLR